MKKWLVRILILTLYCIPFTFLAMYGDAEHGSVLMYVLMVVGFHLLSILTRKVGEPLLMVPGNLLSLAASAICMLLFSTEKWNWYFKPLSAWTCLLLMSAGIALWQALPSRFRFIHEYLNQ